MHGLPIQDQDEEWTRLRKFQDQILPHCRTSVQAKVEERYTTVAQSTVVVCVASADQLNLLLPDYGFNTWLIHLIGM